MSSQAHFTRIFRQWHGRIGAIAAAFFLVLAVTGIVLNHSDALHLDKRQIAAPWLISWYGIQQKPVLQGYRLNKNYLAADAGNWALGGLLLHGEGEETVGAVAIGDIIYIAAPSMVYLYRSDGQLVDKLEGQGLPAAAIERIGTANGAVVLQTQGGQFMSADALSWQRLKSAQVVWSALEALPAADMDKAALALAPRLPLQRILLDLHSGRIFGSYGPLMVDLLGLILAVLCVTGFYMWLHKQRQRHYAVGWVKHEVKNTAEK